MPTYYQDKHGGYYKDERGNKIYVNWLPPAPEFDETEEWDV